MDATEPATTAESDVWVEDLEPDVCWRLLARRPVGRVGFTTDRIPIVVPVNHYVDGGSIVFRTGRSSLLETLRHGARVCSSSTRWMRSSRPAGRAGRAAPPR